MKITANEQIIHITTIKLEGRLDAFNTPKLRRELDQWLDKGVIHFIIDLSDLDFIDSSGLAVLVRLLKRVRLNQGEIQLVWPHHPAPQQILRITGLDRVFHLIEQPYQPTMPFGHLITTNPQTTRG